MPQALPSAEPERLHPEDVQIGAYVADPLTSTLYCVVDRRVVVRDGRRVRMAMLENAVTETIEPWDLGRLAFFVPVNHRRESMNE